MGNANGRGDLANGGPDDPSTGSNGELRFRPNYLPNSIPPPARLPSPDLMANSPPASPARFRSPHMFAPQVPITPLQTNDGPPFFNQMRLNESQGTSNLPPEQGVPTLIIWNYGGNDIAVEGSWDNWTTRKKLQRCGQDHSILLVLPLGIYHYKFIVDGEWRYIPDLPFVADEMGLVCNLLDVNLHSKKRNRLEQRLNDLVYVKYNRTLRFRYDMRNTLDPISLQNIDESNEWLLGRMDGESNEDNKPVFDDDDGLTWATVARASGVEESSHASRATSSRSKAQPRISKSSTLTPLQLIDEEEAGSDDTEEEDVEGYKSTDGEEDDSLLAIDVEDGD